MEEIEVYFNELKAGERLQDVRMFTEAANKTLIPFLIANGLEVNMENVACALGKRDSLIEEYISKFTRDKKFCRLPDVLRKKTIQDCLQKFRASLYDLKTGSGMRDEKSLLRYSRLDDQSGLLVPDEEAIRKEYTVTIKEPEEVAAYNRYMAAIDALNAFFVGKAPLAWNAYFACKNGKFKPNKDVNINWEYYSGDN